MILSLAEQLQKLITEHGSAAVLRERLALLKDQIELLEAKVLLLEGENVALKQQIVSLTDQARILSEENVVLEATNVKLHKLAEELRGEIQKAKDLPQQRLEHDSHDNLLDETKVGILKLLFDADKLEPERIAQALGIGVQAVLFHAEELLKLGYIRQCEIMKEHIEKTENMIRRTIVPALGFTIDQPGRRYIMECGC